MYFSVSKVTRVVSPERLARSPQIITVRVNIAELGEVLGCGRVERRDWPNRIDLKPPGGTDET